MQGFPSAMHAFPEIIPAPYRILTENRILNPFPQKKSESLKILRKARCLRLIQRQYNLLLKRLHDRAASLTERMDTLVVPFRQIGEGPDREQIYGAP